MVQEISERNFPNITQSSSPAAVPAPSSNHPLYFVESPPESPLLSPSPSLPSSYYPRSSSASRVSCDSLPSYNSRSSSASRVSCDSLPSYYSRSSSASRVSGDWSWMRLNPKVSPKAWYDGDDRKDGDDGDDGGCFCFPIVFGIALVLVAFCMIIQGASRPYNIEVMMKSLKIHSFFIVDGSDRSGIPTKLVTINCTATMSIHNPAPFFGIHVSMKSVDLFYSEIRVATCELKKYYLPRKSSEMVSVNLAGHEMPLYGAGRTTIASNDGGGEPLKLELEVQSLGYLIGKLVKTEHHVHISCSYLLVPKGKNDTDFGANSCAYD